MSIMTTKWGQACLSSLLAAVIGVAMAQPSWAQYPEKPINIIIPFAAGSGNDGFARLIAEGLQEKWGQPVIPQNQPGGGGMIGATELARSAPDGYTLMTGSSSHPSGMVMRKEPPVDVRTDITAVARYAFSSGALVVNSDLPVNSMDELVAYSKTNPLNYGSSGVGSIIHLATELFKQATGLEAVHIPYGGGAPAIVATMGNEVQFLLIDYGAAQAAIENGQVRMLAYAGPERLPSKSDIPTIREQGYDFEFNLSYGLFAPAGTPTDILEKLNAAVNEIVAAPKFRDYAENARSSTIVINEPLGVYADIIREEVEVLGKAVDDAGLERQ